MAFLDSGRDQERRRGIDNTSKTLLANIRFLSVDNPIRTMVITSAIPNEGKTFIAANLARAMASSGMRTLVVECDMRRRSMSHELEIHAQHGLYSVISGETPLSEAVVQVSPRLEFLDAEPHIPNPSDLLNTRRFADLVAALRQSYNFVVFDTPPVGTFVDAAVLGARCDAVFMVVRERYTHHAEIARAAEQLRTANVTLTGVIMNFCERQSNEYYYDYYYKEDADGHRRRRRRRSDEQKELRPIVESVRPDEPDQRSARSMPPIPDSKLDFDTEASVSSDVNSASGAEGAGRRNAWDNAPDLKS
ncbi:MAG: CpsD/CapB family tyrosine-protein kinase [Atopobiaceae bacterium]|nr:CpsD/CapB family tyrosine-protein kinase [Atopobiaceae bacterium]